MSGKPDIRERRPALRTLASQDDGPEIGRPARRRDNDRSERQSLLISASFLAPTPAFDFPFSRYCVCDALKVF